mmetsp:Transcript_32398/g.103064  ORF Transcript_32398/g.103064 Transcript_32398/m.103064 type:complete len:234 (-) Transcript_32398:602-1303(-)
MWLAAPTAAEYWCISAAPGTSPAAATLATKLARRLRWLLTRDSYCTSAGGWIRTCVHAAPTSTDAPAPGLGHTLKVSPPSSENSRGMPEVVAAALAPPASPPSVEERATEDRWRPRRRPVTSWMESSTSATSLPTSPVDRCSCVAMSASCVRHRLSASTLSSVATSSSRWKSPGTGALVGITGSVVISGAASPGADAASSRPAGLRAAASCPCASASSCETRVCSWRASEMSL